MNRRCFLASCACALHEASAKTGFSMELWASIASIYQQTLRHPFLTGLKDGSLARSKFQFYLMQDALYLAEFSEALRLLSAKAPKKEWKSAFAKDAGEAVTAEKQMHQSILSGYGVTRQQMEAAKMAPTNYAYTNHLLMSCSRHPFAEGLAAMLPCYWIYWEVGKELKKSPAKNRDYQRWIDQYADESYGKSVERVCAVMDEVAAGLTAAEKARCKHRFTVSAQYEYQFWDMAFREEKWTPLG